MANQDMPPECLSEGQIQLVCDILPANSLVANLGTSQVALLPQGRDKRDYMPSVRRGLAPGYPSVKEWLMRGILRVLLRAGPEPRLARGEVHPAEEVLEARVVTEWIKPWNNV